MKARKPPRWSLLLLALVIGAPLQGGGDGSGPNVARAPPPPPLRPRGMDNTVTKLWRVAGVDAAVHGLVRLRDGGRRSLASHLLGTAVRQLRH